MATALAVGVVAAASTAATGDSARGGGVEIDLPDGWSRVQPAPQSPTDDPRTVLVIGTDGVRAVDSDCMVSTYRVPSDGAVVVVIGSARADLALSLSCPSGLKLRRGTFQCFPDRGAVSQVNRRGLDHQVNVMVGDRASQETIDAALDAARSIAAARHQS